jgi:hypothetical protein
VFKGPVAWTENPTETEPNTTKSNRTVGCSCPLSRLVRLPVVSTQRISKTIERPVAFGCNQSFHSIFISILLQGVNIYNMKSPGKTCWLGEALYMLWLCTDLLVMFCQSGTTLPNNQQCLDNHHSTPSTCPRHPTSETAHQKRTMVTTLTIITIQGLCQLR